MNMRQFSILAVAICFLGGCDAGTGLPLATDFDGEWQITSDNGVSCITIINGAIVEADDGCRGIPLQILNTNQPTITSDKMVWTFRTVASGQIATITLDVSQQSDGTLTGTQSVLIQGQTDADVVDVVMTKMS